MMQPFSKLSLGGPRDCESPPFQTTAKDPAGGAGRKTLGRLTGDRGARRARASAIQEKDLGAFAGILPSAGTGAGLPVFLRLMGK